MNDIPSKFDEGFDFVWSSCALEHLGSLGHGKEFIFNSLRCLKSGGVAVHTTEFNVGSNTDTLEHKDVSVYRRVDIEEIIAKCISEGHALDMNWDYGGDQLDHFIDIPPYTHNPHLKLQFCGFTITSVGLVIRKR